MESLLVTFRCPAVGLGQWSLFQAGGEVMLHAFEIDLLFSTFRCPAVTLGQWSYCLYLRWIYCVQCLGDPQSGWDSGVVACI